MNVFIAGFQHETNTFAPSKADWKAFNCGESFPGFVRGQTMLDEVDGCNLPVTGFVEVARERGWQVLPSVWAGATPSAHVTREAYERIIGPILDDLRDAMQRGSVEAVYLDLHGAAVTEHMDDPEGALIASVRAMIGPAVPIMVSLDLHANVTQLMLDSSDALVAYCTYPHTDMADTGRRAGLLLQRYAAAGQREAMHVMRLPFLLPLNVQSTMTEPAATVYRLLAELERQYDVVLSFAMGFPAADFAECGPVVWGHGARASEAVQALYIEIERLRPQWRLELLQPRAVVAEAMRLSAANPGQPVVIADTQDNPGAGGDSNTTGMLHALQAEGAGKAFPGEVALGLMCDPAAAAAAHAVGVGASIDLVLGKSVPTWGGGHSDIPLQGRFAVRALSDGKVQIKGPMMHGLMLELGPCACLEIDGILVAVSTGKSQMLDRELYRFVGIEPECMKILVNKSSVHFRADFTPIAHKILVGKAPGPMAADPADFPWTRLPAELALRP